MAGAAPIADDPTLALGRVSRRSDPTRRKTIGFWLVYVIVNCHILRNVSPVFYGVLAVTFVPAAITAVLRIMRGAPRGRLYLGVTLYGLFAAWASVQTILDAGPQAGLYATFRFCLTLPMCVLACTALRTETSINRVLQAFVWISLIGILSVAYQYAYGPLAWVAEPGERAGMQRYASVLGSIPVLGAVVPMGLLICIRLRMGVVTRWLLMASLTAGLFLSLSKQAVLGVLLIPVVLIWSSRNDRAKLIVPIVVVGVVIGVAAQLFRYTDIGGKATAYATAVIDSDSSEAVESRGGDVGGLESMIDRVTVLPAKTLNWLLEHRGNAGYLIGGGFKMMGPALMPPDEAGEYCTAHNQYVDFLVIGGAGMLVAFLMILSGTWRTLLQLRKAGYSSDTIDTLLGLFAIFTVSCLFSSGITYQPALSSIFWMIVGVAWRLERHAKELNAGASVGSRAA